MTSLAIQLLQGDALRMAQFFKHASCHPTTQFEDFNHVNADADETKIVTARFVLGFCHGQLAILSASADRPLISFKANGKWKFNLCFIVSKWHEAFCASV